MDAISRVVNTAREATEGKRYRRGSKKYCLIVALDIKNAFNTARWDTTCQAMKQLGVPKYLQRMVRSYFSDRHLKYDTEDGPQEYRVNGGVPQGSVLGPLLWNIMYDALLKLELPRGAELTAFADDAMLTIVAKLMEEIPNIFEESYNMIQQWMGTAGLQLAEHKTEAMLITSRKKVETISLNVGEHSITSQAYFKYLGVMLDVRLSFKQHVEYVAEKAAKVASALARLMPNVGGPRQSRRKLLASVVNSVLTYAIAIWGDALKIQQCRRKVSSVYRLSAIRVSSAFRTVSEDAVCVIAGMLPIHILAEERKKLYQQRCSAPKLREEQREKARAESLLYWQVEWDASVKGTWTRRLIPQVGNWVNRKHGEVNYYLTQMLSGHGCYRQYLHRFKHEDTAECPAGCGLLEDAEHVFFRCPRYNEERAEVQRTTEESLTPDNIVLCMLKSDANWTAVSNFATTVLKKLRQEEQQRRKYP